MLRCVEQFDVEKPGFHTTLQDLGRRAFQSVGVSGGGVMDAYSAVVLNMLLGNSENCAVLETMQVGLRLRVLETTLIAVGGADLQWQLDGTDMPVWRPVLVAAGSCLVLTKCRSGVWGYLAVAGGFCGEHWLGSQSTDLLVGKGGLAGRMVKAGDRLLANCEWSPSTWKWMKKLKAFNERKGAEVASFASVRWQARPLSRDVRTPLVVRVMSGQHRHFFTAKSQYLFFQQVYTVRAESNRMGYRLAADSLQIDAPFREQVAAMRSQPVITGTVQIPPSGQPIVLLADAQTVGGYPVFGYVAAVDLPKLVQVPAGGKVVFVDISVEEAMMLLHLHRRELDEMKVGIECRLSI